MSHVFGQEKGPTWLNLEAQGDPRATPGGPRGVPAGTLG